MKAKGLKVNDFFFLKCSFSTIPCRLSGIAESNDMSRCTSSQVDI
jgi:hypothetical protein